MIGRRGFIQALAVLGATAGAGVAVAAIVKDPTDKYRQAQRLFFSCVSVASNKVQVSSRFNDLLIHCHASFSPVPEPSQKDRQAIRDVKAGMISAEDVLKIPPAVPDSVYPLALAIIGFRVYDMDVVPDLVPEWSTFSDRYWKLAIEVL